MQVSPQNLVFWQKTRLALDSRAGYSFRCSGLAAFDLALFRQLLRGRTRGLCVSGRAKLLPLYTLLASLRPQLLATWAWGPEQREDHSQYGLVLQSGGGGRPQKLDSAGVSDAKLVLSL